MIIIRPVHCDDLKALRQLSRQLNTVNLPCNLAALREMITISERSFSHAYKKLSKCQYVFVMERTDTHEIIGTSKILARHGNARKPHLYFQVLEEPVVVKSLQLAKTRKFYRLKQDKQGFTELGGLLLKKGYRHHAKQLGKQLSFIRLMYIKAFPSFFKRRLLVELLPPLHRGQSSLWNFYGRKLTGMSYHRADWLSYHDKEFILKLFPQADLYHDLLPERVRQDIEQTGPGSSKARYLLEQIGFHYAQQIDPFDGGPHYTADRTQVSVYRQTRAAKVCILPKIRAGRKMTMYLVMRAQPFQASLCAASLRSGRISLSAKNAEALGVSAGEKLYAYRWQGRD